MATPSSPFHHETPLRLSPLIFSSHLSSPVLRWGGTGAFGPNLKLRLFSRPFGIQLATLNRAGRLSGVWQVRSSIAFSQTLHGPRGHPRDWASEQSAFEHCRFSSFQTSCTSHFPFLNQRDRASSSHCSRKAMMCAKPFESEIPHSKRGFCLLNGNENAAEDRSSMNIHLREKREFLGAPVPNRCTKSREQSRSRSASSSSRNRVERFREDQACRL